jgi:hypothetical protein
MFIGSRLQGFAGSRFQIFIDSTTLKTYFMNFGKPDVLRVAGFFNSPIGTQQKIKNFEPLGLVTYVLALPSPRACRGEGSEEQKNMQSRSTK